MKIIINMWCLPVAQSEVSASVGASSQWYTGAAGAGDTGVGGGATDTPLRELRQEVCARRDEHFNGKLRAL